MKHRDKYELVYRQLCKDAGIKEAKSLTDAELLSNMNARLSELNCELFTIDEIVKLIKS